MNISVDFDAYLSILEILEKEEGVHSWKNG